MELANTFRRKKPRLRLGVKAEIITLDGREEVLLQDLSLTGAKFHRNGNRPFDKGLLRWMRYETYGEVVWQRGSWVGIQFDRPISKEVLLATRAATPRLVQEARSETERYARDIVLGRRVAR